jgi:prophage regulatory protein
MQHEFFRWRTVHNATQLSRSTVWRLERIGQFPARRQLSGNSVGWLRSEVEAWIATRAPAARSAVLGK